MFSASRTKRKCPRIKITGQARVLRGIEVEEKGDLAQIVEVSMNGVSLMLNSELEVDREYLVRMNIYPNMEFNFGGQVVWMTNNNGARIYGLQFKSIDMNNKIKLQQIIINNLMG